MLNKVKGYENREVYMERSLAVVEKMETLVKELLYLSKTDESQKSEYKMIVCRASSGTDSGDDRIIGLKKNYRLR